MSRLALSMGFQENSTTSGSSNASFLLVFPSSNWLFLPNLNHCRNVLTIVSVSKSCDTNLSRQCHWEIKKRKMGREKDFWEKKYFSLTQTKTKRATYSRLILRINSKLRHKIDLLVSSFLSNAVEDQHLAKLPFHRPLYKKMGFVVIVSDFRKDRRNKIPNPSCITVGRCFLSEACWRSWARSDIAASAFKYTTCRRLHLILFLQRKSWKEIRSKMFNLKKKELGRVLASARKEKEGESVTVPSLTLACDLVTINCKPIGQL